MDADVYESLRAEHVVAHVCVIKSLVQLGVAHHRSSQQETGEQVVEGETGTHDARILHSRAAPVHADVLFFGDVAVLAGVRHRRRGVLRVRGHGGVSSSRKHSAVLCVPSIRVRTRGLLTRVTQGRGLAESGPRDLTGGFTRRVRVVAQHARVERCVAEFRD